MCVLQVSGEEVSKLLVSGIEPIKGIDPCFAEFTYTPRSLPDDSTPMVNNQSCCNFICLRYSKLRRRDHVMSVCSVSSTCLKTWDSSTRTRLTCTLSPGHYPFHQGSVKNCVCVCVSLLCSPDLSAITLLLHPVGFKQEFKVDKLVAEVLPLTQITKQMKIRGGI